MSETVTTDDEGRTVHTYTSDGSFAFPPVAANFDFLVVGGGGGGASGGGGGGGVFEVLGYGMNHPGAVWPVRVGAGGAAGNLSGVDGGDGGESSFGVPGDLIFPMTSSESTWPGQIVTTSSQQGGGYEGWHVTDDTASYWESLAVPAWLRVHFNVSLLMESYAITVNEAAHAPTAWQLQGGWEDNFDHLMNWAVLDSQSGVSWSDYQRRVFPAALRNFQSVLDPAGKWDMNDYPHFRLYVSACPSSRVRVAGLEFGAYPNTAYGGGGGGAGGNAGHGGGTGGGGGYSDAGPVRGGMGMNGRWGGAGGWGRAGYGGGAGATGWVWDVQSPWVSSVTGNSYAGGGSASGAGLAQDYTGWGGVGGANRAAGASGIVIVRYGGGPAPPEPPQPIDPEPPGGAKRRLYVY